VKLVRPAREWLPSYFAFIDEMRANGDTIWPSRVPSEGQSDDAFIEQLLAKETTEPAPPAVPESVYWALVDDDIIGVIALRHRLTEKLARFGGHVGYEVKPSARRRGYATTMLHLLLETDRARSIGKILITCAPTNTGSRRAIEANGAVLESIIYVDEIKRDTCRYWIHSSAMRTSNLPS
jgi:predicted acetyltransferase